MRNYECIIIFPTEAAGGSSQASEKTMEALVNKASGKITNKIEWGKRRLGYEIRKQREGRFYILDIALDPANVAKFRKTLELEESILKYFIKFKDPKLEKAARLQKAEAKLPGKTSATAEPAEAPAKSS